ncbi:MAG: hypothetical protein RR295_04515 [Oscillospiraceae bacterium]
MENKQLVKPGKVLSYAGAFMAFLIGSGFATGQEVLQYFASYGLGGGLLVALICVLLFIFVGGCFVSAGKRENFAKGSDIFQYYCGKYIGTFYDYFTILFVFMSFVVMIAGAGATMNQHFGLPTWLGSVLMMILVCVTTIFGLSGIIDVIGKLGPVIAIFAICLGFYAFFSNPGGVVENTALLASGSIKVMQAGTNPITSAGSYVGFCMLWLAAFLAAMGKGTNSQREGVLGTTVGAIGFTLGCTAMMLGLLANLPMVADSQIPALVLAGQIGSWLSMIFSVIIFAGIFTTAVPLLWQVSSRFTVEGSKSFKLTTVVCAVVGSVVAMFLPFNKLVNIIYGINGYVGILLLAFIIVKEVRRKLKPSAPKA